MAKAASFTLTPAQEAIVQRFEGYCVGVRGYELDTYASYVRWFAWILGHGFNWPRFASGQDAAWGEGCAWLAHRRRTANVPGFNAHVKVLNVCAEMLGYGLRFKPARNPPRAGRPNTPAERARAFRFKSRHKEFLLRTLAVFQFSQETGARRSAVWGLHEQHLDPVKSLVFIAKPGKLGKPGWIPVRRALWDPTHPFGRWLSVRPRAADDPGWVWTTSHSGRPRRVAKGTLTQSMRKLSRATGTKVNFVTGRYTTITETTAPETGEGDVVVAKERARHTRLETTMGYASVPEKWVVERYQRIQRPPLIPKKGRKQDEHEANR